jgi:hypothetical protein
MATANLREGEFGGSDSDTTTGGTSDATQRQPTTFDYSQQNQFKIYLPIFPTTEWFVTRATVPGISLGQASVPTPLSNMQFVGEKVEFSNFDMSFMVDERLDNYMEMYGWVKNIGFPKAHTQFMTTPRPDGITIERKVATPPRDRGTVTGTVNASDRDLYTDIAMTILSSKNNAVALVTMYDAFPVAMGAIEYSQQESDTIYATCDVSFAFTWFDVSAISSNA